MRTSAHRALGAAVAAALFVAACGDDSDSGDASSGESDDGTAEPQDTGGGGSDAADGDLDPDSTFRLSYSVGPSRWDAHRASSSFDNTSLFLTYDRLIHLDGDAEPVPGLAEEWEFAEDGSYLELSLREGVTFHDGEPFDAEAVAANIERGQTVQGSAVAGELGIIDDVEVIDDSTVRLHVSGPAASLPLSLSDRPGVMISPAAFDDPNLDQQPVGAGMFEVTAYEPGGSISYAAYADYWDDDAVNVAGVEFLVQADSITRLNAIRDDQVDWTFIDPADAQGAESAGFEVDAASASLAYYHMQMNRSFEPFSDLRVRQAMNHAIDRDAIVDGLLRGYGAPSVQVFPEGYFAYDAEIGNDYYDYDPDRASELLEEAGYGDGFEFELLIPAISYFADVGAAIQAQLQEIGVDASIRTIPNEQFADMFYAQEEGDAGFVPWGGRHDPSLTVGLQFTEGGFSNPGQHSTDAVMEAYAATLEVQSDEERAEALQALSSAVTTDALDVSLYFQYTPILTNDRVVDYVPFMSGKPEFRGVGMLAE